MPSPIKALIGLGNPGPKFVYTRHNIGFRVLDALAEKYGADWTNQHNVQKSTITINDQTLLLVKPQTFMNNSGEAIPGLKKQGIHAENILVVHDELEKPFGNVSIKQGGSAKGHNGLRSLIQYTGPDFWRVRVGIGRPQEKEQVPHYVLENFSEPQESVESSIQKAITLIEKFVTTSTF